jgi:Uncharacterized protein conserved in bacteria
MKKLNLGCGSDILEGYVNVDIRKAKGVDVVVDITKKLPFKDKSFEEVLAQDVLEHLILADQENLLLEINRILIDSGTLKIRTPNIEAILELLADDPETRNLFLYGETEEQGEWGAHKAGHTLLSIATLFRMCGFKISKYREKDTNWEFDLVKEKLVGEGKVWQINKPVKNFWKYRFLRFFVDEWSVPNKQTYDSLFPLTHIPMSRVKINQLEWQKRRAYARQLAKMDLGI